MKKFICLLAAAVSVAACKTGPAVVEGVIKGYGGQTLSINTVYDFATDTIAVSEDGSFRFEKMVPGMTDAYLRIDRSIKGNLFIIPGENHRMEIDLGAASPQWQNLGAGVKETEFSSYYKDAFSLREADYPDTFKEYSDSWDAKYADVTAKLNSTVSNRKSKAYFKDNLRASLAFHKLGYFWWLQKSGAELDSDSDFNDYFNSIDLDDKVVSRSVLSSMIQMKAMIGEKDFPYSISYLNALDELVRDEHVRDSLKLKFVDKEILNSDISTKEEGDTLLAVAGRLVDDESTMELYRHKIEKACSLLRGCEAIDFKLVDEKGRVTMLSDFKGKVVYIDMWASWCIPCCMQIPYMKVLAEKYASDKDVACISLSFDNSCTDMVRMFVREKPSWPQFLAENSGNDIMVDYGFRAIPRFMIFDKEGKIVSTNAPRPQDLDAVVKLIEEVR